MDELTRKELFSDIDKRTLKYSKKVKGSKYIGITKDFVINMDVPSVTADPSTYYRVRIKLIELPDLLDDSTLTTEEKLRLSLDGDIKISCTCPAYTFWGYKYITTQLSANESDPENRFPHIRNKNLEGTLCKHAYVAARSMGRVWKRIAKDIDTMNYIE